MEVSGHDSFDQCVDVSWWDDMSTLGGWQVGQRPYLHAPKRLLHEEWLILDPGLA